MLNAGEAKTVEVKLDARAFSYWSEKTHASIVAARGISSDGGRFVGEYAAESEPDGSLGFRCQVSDVGSKGAGRETPTTAGLDRLRKNGRVSGPFCSERFFGSEELVSIVVWPL